jgi:hypothetical protein
MKRHAYVVAIVLLGVLTGPARGAVTQAGLEPFVGKWKAMMSFVEAGGRVTVSLAEDANVTAPDQNTIIFQMKRTASGEGPVFDTRLTYDRATKTYLLSVRTDSGDAIERMPVTYAEGTGFSGEGTLTHAGGTPHTVKATIVAVPDGGYEWTVNAPPENQTVFSFTFIKRIQ